MSVVNVILPDGATYQTAEAIPNQTTTIINTIEERHEVAHTTDELNVPNVLIADHDEAYDVADTGPGDPNAISSQKFNQVPKLLHGNKFETRDHINDADATTDSSSIKMFRTIYIEPPPNKPAGFMAPTIFTSGSICVCGEGAIGYIPYSVSGQQIPNTEYRLGRGPTLGDRSHDNDGLLMTVEKTTNLIGTTVHKVHISPEPSDPAILVESRRTAPFLKFIDRGPDETDVTAENTVFMIDSGGHIHCPTIVSLGSRVDDIDSFSHGTQQRMELNLSDIETLQTQMFDLMTRVDALELANQ